MAYRNIPFLFGAANGTAEVKWVIDDDAEKLSNLATLLPGVNSSQDWKAAVADPTIDLVDICLPDSLHFEVARQALESGKHVYCEKPLTNSAREAEVLVRLAREKGVVTRVGHAFPRNPIHDVAKDIIDSGEIGEIKLFRGAQHVDVLGDPKAPFMWRADGKLAPTGIVGDTGSHVFSFMERLVGRVGELIADCNVVTKHRPVVKGFNYGVGTKLTGGEEMAEVTNTDATNLLCRFENGAMGIVDFSRVATGRKFLQTYEIYGTKGSIAYNYDEINRLRFYSEADPIGRRGYREIDVGPENKMYATFLPIPNFGLGYNETKQIEVAEVVHSIVTGQDMWPTFESGHHIAQIVDACLESSSQRQWVKLN
jgi:predicted dehydrogenase